MSRIDELIAELAPEGVRHVALSEVVEYSPTRVDAADLDETSFVGVDNLVSDKGGRVDASYPPNTARLTAYEPGDILLGNIRPYLKKVWLATNAGGCSGDVLAVRIMREHRESLNPAFLYYLLSSDGFFAYNMQHAKGAKMPRGNKSAILSYRIPVPPLDVQREIVRVLDQFTQLEAELEAELEARRVQYAHYRHSAVGKLRFADHDWVPLASIADIRTGTKPDETSDVGAFPYINAGNEPSGFTSRANSRGNIITIPSRGQGGAGHVGYQKGDFWCGPLCYRVESKSRDLLTRFLYFYLRNVQDELVALRKVGSIPAVNKSDLGTILVPVVPVEEQQRVVEMLDRLDALVNDLSIGLPAELAARRKQYEYYRDKLLTFEEAAA